MTLRQGENVFCITGGGSFCRMRLELLDAAGLRAPVLESLLDAIQLHLDRRAGEAFRVGAVLFSNQHGPLGATQIAKELLEQWNNA